MRVFLNGFWEGFVERTDGVHFGVFESILSRVFEQPIQLTSSMTDADILLESHCAPSVFSAKSWKYSIFFSGEGSMSVPDHAERYSAVLGALKTRRNHVKCPLFLLYDVCRPAAYPIRTEVPPKGVCAIISSDQNPANRRDRTALVDELIRRGLRIDMGGAYGNNIGFKVPGSYADPPIIEFQSQYRVVLALENTKLDEYITEKVLNPLRAGTVPMYYGSDRVSDYIHPDRIVRVSDDIDQVMTDIQRLCTDDAHWLHIVNHPQFVKPVASMVDTIVDDLKRVMLTTDYAVEIIGNPEKEPERMGTLQVLIDYYSALPSVTCYGSEVLSSPLYSKFDPRKGINVISLAVNHITLLERYASSNQFLVVFESDAIPMYPMNEVDAGIRSDIQTMRNHGIDFAFVGHGCVNVGADVYTNPANRVGRNLYFPRYVSVNGASRCTESYIVSPNGIRSFLAWFRPRVNHDAIDWAFNHYFIQTPTALGCWRHPVLFRQGSEDKLYPSLLDRV